MNRRGFIIVSGAALLTGCGESPVDLGSFATNFPLGKPVAKDKADLLITELFKLGRRAARESETAPLPPTLQAPKGGFGLLESADLEAAVGEAYARHARRTPPTLGERTVIQMEIVDVAESIRTLELVKRFQRVPLTRDNVEARVRGLFADLSSDGGVDRLRCYTETGQARTDELMTSVSAPIDQFLANRTVFQARATLAHGLRELLDKATGSRFTPEKAGCDLDKYQ